MLVELDEGKSRTGDVEDEEVPELADTLGITKVRNCPFCKECSSLSWSVVVADRLSTHKNIRVQRVFHASRLQECSS